MIDPIELQGEQRTYRLQCVGTNVLCRLEDATGKPYEMVLAELRRPKARAVTIRAFVAAALVDPVLTTLDEVGQAIDDLGGVDVIRQAARLAYEKPAKRKAMR